MKKQHLLFLSLTLSLLSGQAMARDTIRIVGSSTVFPYTTVVAERFAALGFKVPVVESTGTGGGMKLFCSGVGETYPDGVNASRPMTKAEFETCNKNGVHSVTEMKIGYDGIVLAGGSKGMTLSLTRAQIFKALAAQVPVNGQWKPNTVKTWKEIDPALPNEKIEVLGPPSTSGTRDAFIEMGMEKGCVDVAKAAGIEVKPSDPVCKIIREDGVWIDAGEQDNLIVQKVSTSPHLLGILGFDYFENNQDKLKAINIEGFMPNFENIVQKKYPFSRPLFVYLKNQNIGVVTGIPEFVKEYASEKAIGDDGYLLSKGLIPMETKERKEAIQSALSFQMFKPSH